MPPFSLQFPCSLQLAAFRKFGEANIWLNNSQKGKFWSWKRKHTCRLEIWKTDAFVHMSEPTLEMVHVLGSLGGYHPHAPHIFVDPEHEPSRGPAIGAIRLAPLSSTVRDNFPSTFL